MRSNFKIGRWHTSPQQVFLLGLSERFAALGQAARKARDALLCGALRLYRLVGVTTALGGESHFPEIGLAGQGGAD